jgi:hypothetical protein
LDSTVNIQELFFPGASYDRPYQTRIGSELLFDKRKTIRIVGALLIDHIRKINQVNGPSEELFDCADKELVIIPTTNVRPANKEADFGVLG